MSDTPPCAGRFRKSTRSNDASACVEVANLPGGINLVRDSKLGDDSPVLAVPASQFDALLAEIKADRLA
jgi:hypothetical protein